MRDRTYKSKVRGIILILAIIPIVIASLFLLHWKITNIYSNADNAIEQCSAKATEQINEYVGTALQRIRFITYYSKINSCLMQEEKIRVDGETLRLNDEINNVLDAMFSDNNLSDIVIFTTNPNAVQISRVNIVDDSFFADKKLVNDESVWRIEEEDLRTYLVVYKKYSVISNYYNVIRIRIPLEQIMKCVSENTFHKIYADIKTDSQTENSFGYENGKLFKWDKQNIKKLYVRNYRIDSIQGNLSIAIENQSIIHDIIKYSVIYVVSVFGVLLLIAFLTRLSADNITKEIAEIISGIDRDNIAQINHTKIKNKEFIIIQKYLSELVDRLKAENKERLELQLQVLNQRITPHFLYNNLSAIKSKCNDKETRVAVDGLIKYCRSVFSAQSSFITVEQEIKNSCTYLELLQFCYDFDFEIQTVIEEDTKLIQIPINILQPICENAFLHGLNRMPDHFHGVIKIAASREENYLIIDVADNAGQLKNTRMPESKNRLHALDILRKLIDIQYSDKNCGIELNGNQNETHTVVRMGINHEI